MADLKSNFQAGLALLKLAVEQMWSIDPTDAAASIADRHVANLRTTFEGFLKQHDRGSLDESILHYNRMLVAQGRQFLMQHISQRHIAPPPGLGFENMQHPRLSEFDIRPLEESYSNYATPTSFTQNLATNSNRTRTSYAPATNTVKQLPTPEPSDQSLASSIQSDEPSSMLIEGPDLGPAPSFSPKASPVDLLIDRSTETNGPPADDSRGVWRGMSLRQTSKLTSWAHVAGQNLPTATVATSESTDQASHKPADGDGRIVPAPPDQPETVEQEARVIWVVNLPKDVSLHDLGSRIKHGPVMSIKILDEKELKKPAATACIIFENADAAKSCVESKTLEYQPSIDVHFGAPYPRNTDILNMNMSMRAEGKHPHRRRLKWSYNRLFHSVSLKQFKTDIIAMCGAENIELVHFYNPGECTIIFASVPVAREVWLAFKDWSGNKRHKYYNVECSFARDFNEIQPAPLKSSYRKDDQVRRRGADNALAGVWSGPKVEGI